MARNLPEMFVRMPSVASALAATYRWFPLPGGFSFLAGTASACEAVVVFAQLVFAIALPTAVLAWQAS